MKPGRKDGRILIYSHDTFGLGHLSRCRTIAHSLVERFKHLSVLILSGSPIIGSFDFRSRVDFVRVTFTGNTATGGLGGAGTNVGNGQGKGGAVFVLVPAEVTGVGLTFSGNAASDDTAIPGDDDDVFGPIF